MSDFIRGLEVFNASNKAGSIPHFTTHLEKYPDDYKALMRRAKAHEIIGNVSECKADVARAADVSSGVEKMVADAEMAKLTGNAAQWTFLLGQIVQLYPHYAPGLSNLAEFYYHAKKYDEALSLLHKAIETAKEHQQTDAPNYCWDNTRLGDIYYSKGKFDLAEDYFKTAIESSNSLTVAHIGLSKVYLMKHQLHEARQHFDAARRLNPILVRWKSFDAFQYDLENSAGAPQPTREEQLEQIGLRKKTVSGNEMAPGKTPESDGSGKKTAGGNKRSGRGTDDDDESISEADSLWKKLKKESPKKAKYRGITLVLSTCGKYWYSRDKAEHGGCRFKVYKNRGDSLLFLHGADEKLNPIPKHESCERNPVIPKKDLNYMA